MSAPPPVFRPRRRGKPARATDLGDLMKLLVDELAAGRHALPPIDGRSDAEQIIVETEIDGMRYLLMRKPTASHAPVVLSPREHEIVRMVAQGHPNKIIANALNISSWTVSTHLRHIFAKFGVGSRAAMVAKYGAMEWRRNGTAVRSE